MGGLVKAGPRTLWFQWVDSGVTHMAWLGFFGSLASLGVGAYAIGRDRYDEKLATFSRQTESVPTPDDVDDQDMVYIGPRWHEVEEGRLKVQWTSPWALNWQPADSDKSYKLHLIPTLKPGWNVPPYWRLTEVQEAADQAKMELDFDRLPGDVVAFKQKYLDYASLLMRPLKKAQLWLWATWVGIALLLIGAVGGLAASIASLS